MSNAPRNLTRNQLATIGKDPRAIRALEQLLKSVADSLPTDIDTINRLIEEVTIEASSASNQAQQAIDALNRLANSIELLALAPLNAHTVQAALDLAPPQARPLVAEIADVKSSVPGAGHLLIYDATLKQWRNAAITPGTNVTVTNADGSITLAVSGAPPIGSAGGVLSGTYPNPGFAVDMATQAELDAAIATREPTIAAGTTSQYWRGDKSWQTLNTAAVTESTNLYFTDARVRAAVLTGFAAGTNTAIAATDTVLQALQKAQGQINAREGTITAGTTSQYWRGDKSWQTLDKTAVGLANVDNTADANKNVATAVSVAGGAANQVPYQTGAGATAFSNNFLFDGSSLILRSAGSPIAWDAGYYTYQVGGSARGTLMAAGDQTELLTNAYFSGGAWKYQTTGVAALRYMQSGGVHRWYRAPSGTAGATITWTLVLTVDANGEVYGATGATGMTSGFVRIPSAAGAPTGVPNAVANTTPLYYDTTNNKLYAYNGAWKQVTLT